MCCFKSFLRYLRTYNPPQWRSFNSMKCNFYSDFVNCLLVHSWLQTILVWFLLYVQQTTLVSQINTKNVGLHFNLNPIVLFGRGSSSLHTYDVLNCLIHSDKNKQLTFFVRKTWYSKFWIRPCAVKNKHTGILLL